jgi:hypothetical protein
MTTSNTGGHPSNGDSNKYYTAKKGGTVTILDLENYPEFSMTCQTVLIANGIWGIVSGTEDRPQAAANRARWDERAGTALGILNSSVIPAIRSTFNQFLVPYVDPNRIWTHLQSYDRSNDPIYVNTIRAEFNSFTLDPSKTRILDGVLKLQRLKNLLATTNRSITDTDIKDRILASLPDSDYWRTARISVMN